MNFNLLKKDPKYYWTQHVIRKMAFYGLSPDRVRRVIRNPKRREDGVAENTIAVMVPGSNKKKPSEMWVMYSLSKKASTLSLPKGNIKKVIISAWRYPGVSPAGKQIPIPHDILEELQNEGIISE